MTRAARCRAFGLRIATDIALPGAIADDDREPPNVVVRRVAPAPPSVPADGDTGRDLWREGDTLRFVPPGIADYRCTVPPTSPSTIEVAPRPGAEEEAIAALLIATALPGLLWLRGGFVLHAAAALMPGTGALVAVAGASGAGKSTILAQLVARGAGAAADDSLCLSSRGEGGEGIVAGGLPGGYFAPHPDPAARPFVTTDPRRAVVEAPLGAILLLARHAGDRPASFQRLVPLDALGAVLAHRHRPMVPALFGDPARRLADAARVARTPTFRWSRPDGSATLTPDEWEWMARLGG